MTYIVVIVIIKMNTVQTKIPFSERKKSSTLKFYSQNKIDEDLDNKSTSKTNIKKSSRRSTRVRKIAYLDSDEENLVCNNQDNLRTSDDDNARSFDEGK